MDNSHLILFSRYWMPNVSLNREKNFIWLDMGHVDKVYKREISRCPDKTKMNLVPPAVARNGYETVRNIL